MSDIFDSEPVGSIARLKDKVEALFFNLGSTIREEVRTRLREEVLRWLAARHALFSDLSPSRECWPGSRSSRVREDEAVGVSFVEYTEGDGLQFFPPRELSDEECMVRVAALHDYALHDRPIIQPGELPIRQGISWAVLLSRVGELSEDAHGEKLAALLAWFREVVSHPASTADTPRTKPHKRSEDDGREVSKKAKEGQIKLWIEKQPGGRWYGTLKELKEALSDRKTGIGYSPHPSTLSRYLRGTSLIVKQVDGSHLPRRHPKGGPEAVAEGNEPGEQLDAYTMPDD